MRSSGLRRPAGSNFANPPGNFVDKYALFHFKFTEVLVAKRFAVTVAVIIQERQFFLPLFGRYHALRACPAIDRHNKLQDSLIEDTIETDCLIGTLNISLRFAEPKFGVVFLFFWSRGNGNRYYASSASQIRPNTR